MYGEKLKNIREENNYNQETISKILEIDRGQYSHYEREYDIIPLKHLNTLCNYFNVSLDYIFSFTNIKQYNNIINDIDKKLTGKRLKEFRKDNKITQQYLSTLLKLGYGTISGYERGRYLIATPFLYTICKKYGISADYLLGKIDSPKTF